MKNIRLIWLPLFLASIFACVQNKSASHQPGIAPNYQLALQFEIPPSADPRTMLDSAKNVLLKRLGEVYYNKLTVDADRYMITLDLIGTSLDRQTPSDSLLRQMVVMLANEGRLEFYNTHRLSDDSISQSFPNLLKENTSLANLLKISDTGAAPIGFVTPEHLTEVDSILKKAIVRGRLPSTALQAWSFRPADVDGVACHTLYLLKGAPVLTGKAIAEAEAAPSEFDPKETVINLTFEAGSVPDWATMTTEAAQNGNREIAIVLNGWVLSAPRVINPITEGKAQITGNFSMAEAKGLSHVLKNSQLPCRVRVVSARVLR